MARIFLTLALFCLSLAPSTGAAQGTQRLTIIGGPPAGVFGIFATGIATYLSKSVPNLDVSHAAGEGAVANIRRLNAGDAEMALSFASDLHEAFFGLEKFKGAPAANVRAIGLVFIGVAHLVTYADSGIQTVNDLVGKRVAVGSPGTGTFSSAERLLGTLGLWDRVTRIPLLGAAAGAAMSEGKADAYFWTGPRPDRVTMEAATKKPVRMLDVYNPAAKMDFFKHYPYFTRYVYPAGSYPGVTQDVPTFGVSLLWFAHRDQPAALIQKMAASIYSADGLAHMVKVHGAAKDMVPEKALVGVTIPLHKGADDHWKSAGLQISDAIRAK